MSAEESTARSSRLHVGGKLSFRRRVPRAEDPQSDDLPYHEFSENPPPLPDLVPDGYDQVEIEVGPGKGTFLLAASKVRPDTFLLGIEAAPSYARYSAERLRNGDRENAAVLVDNAKLYLRDRVPAGALARLHVYFADPWPKRRHRKRRFFSTDMPAVMHRAVAPDGWLLVATDNAAYAGQICTVLGRHDGWVRDEAEEERIRNLPPGHGFSPTNFERKYREECRIIRQYAYRRA